MVKEATGASYPAVSDRIVKSSKLPLPSLIRQKQIAKLLHAVDELRRKCNRAVRLADELASELFIAQFGLCKPGMTDWPTSKVEEVGRVQLGRQRSPRYQTGNFRTPYLRVANVYEDRIDVKDVLTMDFDQRDFADYELKHGDILLNEGQSTELVGRPAMWRNEIDGCCFQNTLIRFQADRRRTLPEFALGVFLQYFRNREFSKLSSKTSNVAHLGASRFASMPFPVPPIELQLTFERRTNLVRKLRMRYEAETMAAETLFRSLQCRVFTQHQ
jgi:type I restriction enzyme S subunit